VIKDLIETAGIRTTRGSRAYAGHADLLDAWAADGDYWRW
jgi:Asp-tRNA(Asn)/Glu-tRNA(Gln) amidotransferase A subunit family amidase